jgi:uncharacterized protein YyaL (SSP411 family)
MSDLKGIPNKLIDEKSSYLLQHAAYNPVNWYPWGEEVFAKAKEEDKLILLSMWCLVNLMNGSKRHHNNDISKYPNRLPL